MIKADIYIKLSGVNTEEQSDGNYKVSCPCVLYSDELKQNEIARVNYEFKDLSLEELALPAIYMRVASIYQNPSFV